MKLFTCDCCGNLLYFENTTCVRCGAQLGFLTDAMHLSVISVPDDHDCNRLSDPGRLSVFRKCANYTEYNVCNWMVPAESEESLCVACRLNRTIPNLETEDNLTLWHRLEIEKRRLVFSLLRLRLPVEPLSSHANGLEFDFLADSDPVFSDRGRVITGHDEGLITINIAEADPVTREQMQAAMDEHYRTILGHFRHESGHYYWNRLIRDTEWLGPCRELFGDDTLDYSTALELHYQAGPPPDWQERFVSAYAASHPWEDWAETWAHYLHIMDTLETAHQFGIQVDPMVKGNDELDVSLDFDPYQQDRFEVLTGHWLPVSFALNSLNRSMGHDHAYPFVLSPLVLKKLDFIHRVVREVVSTLAVE
ncbi:MAG: putative zinc-binding peptidase [Desulfotignum sp.]|nr:putative zinc-binding peptidase [Desulfotignum sp.]MCF8137981.1 putative zinc-binding peptidase [Desulfotignum sp.]